jgi:hypothetical protein
MLSNNRIRLFGATKEASAARWCADNIGQPEQERIVESYTSSAADGRDSINARRETKAEHIVHPNTIQNLPDLTFYLRYQEFVTKISFPHYPLKRLNQVALRNNTLTLPKAGKEKTEDVQRIMPSTISKSAPPLKEQAEKDSSALSKQQVAAQAPHEYGKYL